MTNKMLIDAVHPEETRIVVLRENRIDEFDFEAANRKQLRGNIYLAKVMRVEPSLQAAFVDYGGNRHGFLTFGEIHPDYYQIPVADRQALIEKSRSENDAGDGAGNNAGEANGSEGTDERPFESVGSGDALEEIPEPIRVSPRDYKIQEVIKRRQILLVQVVKEERGSKGAALTTYLSLAGRYAVLMPNSARGGGISRKVSAAADRKRLKEVAQELAVPEGMGVILRTAGATRTRGEIKRDFEYLLRHWENVRELTLQSIAPTLVYEEGSLIKRSIRDLYSRDVDEILVAGDAGYREAKGFMKMLIPSHARHVQPYRDNVPIFSAHNVEPQLEVMFLAEVALKSGGYIVINQTEALVAIDINSGKSTKEHNVEDTAYRTNLEATEEIARQLRLRDLAGLVVIDFIDMEDSKNNRAVERKLKDCLKSDRSRIQVGRISHFGLLEMSRQRMRTGVLESSTTRCKHCDGLGIVRSVESVSLHVLRSLEAYLINNPAINLGVVTRSAVALYILNYKRAHLSQIEERFSIQVAIHAEDGLEGDSIRIEPLPSEPDAAIPQPTSDQQTQNPANSNRQAAQEADKQEGAKPPRARRGRRGSGRGASKSDDIAANSEENIPEKSAEAESGPTLNAEAQPEGGATQERDGKRDKRRRNRRNIYRIRGKNQPTDMPASDEREKAGKVEAGAGESLPPSQDLAVKDAPGDGERNNREGRSAPPRRPRRSRSKKAVISENAPAAAKQDATQDATQDAAQAPAQAAMTASKAGGERAGEARAEARSASQKDSVAANMADGKADSKPTPTQAPSDNKEGTRPSPKQESSGEGKNPEDADNKSSSAPAKRRRLGWWNRRGLFS